MQEKSKLKVIGILGSSKGEGVTTLAIAMANYLAEIMYVKTAILEGGLSNDFELMVKGNCIAEQDTCFFIGKVDYYYGMDTSLFFATYANEYEYIIIDFGSDFKKFKDNISILKHKIVLGSALPYKYMYHDKLMKNLSIFTVHQEVLHLMSGDEKSVRNYVEKNHINALSAPVIVNPYIIENELANFFQLLF